MGQLIVRVREVEQIIPHPDADKLEICILGGWHCVVRKGGFSVGQRVIYFPPDSILPPELANGPDDDPPGRLNVARYCVPLPKDENGVPLPGNRVIACRLRGQPSFGVLMALSEEDPDWKLGEDVASYYGITKWMPPLETTTGDIETPHPMFHRYTDLQHFSDFPNAFSPREEIIITEKLHGKNFRVGLIPDVDDEGRPDWKWMAGSCDVQRKEFIYPTTRFNAVELIEEGILSKNDLEIGKIFVVDNNYWKITEFRETEDDRILFQAVKVDEKGELVRMRSEFWTPLDDLKPLLKSLVKTYDTGVIVFGEIIGPGITDMAYGLAKPSYRVFDISANFQYLDFDEKAKYFKKYDIPMVPVLYRGPFSCEVIEEHTSGDTRMCSLDKAGRFGGREGIVITPVRERFSPELNGRLILRSVSADYLGRGKIKGYEAQDEK